MKIIPLTRGKCALVDEGDYDSLIVHKWYCTSNGYAARSVHDGQTRYNIYMHRQIMAAREYADLIDHISGDKLDNRRSNLRHCTKSQNTVAGRSRTGGVSRFRGVSPAGYGGRWYASITVNWKGIGLGKGHLTEEAAARAYDEAARRYFGAYARLNFPSEREDAA